LDMAFDDVSECWFDTNTFSCTICII